MSVLYKALQKAAQENQAQAQEQAVPEQAAADAAPPAEPPPAEPPPAEPPPVEPPPVEPPPPVPPAEPESTAPLQEAVPHHEEDEDEDDGKFEAMMAAPAASAPPKRGKFLSTGGDKMDMRVMVGGGVLVVLIVLLAFFFLQGGPAPPPQTPQVVQAPAPAQQADPAPIVSAETGDAMADGGAPSIVEQNVGSAADPIVVSEAPVELEAAPIVEDAVAPIIEDAPVQSAGVSQARPSIVPQRDAQTTSGDVDASQLTPEQMAAIPVDEPMPIVSEDDPARSLSPPISIRRSSLALAGVGDAVQVREVSNAARNNASAGYEALVRGDFDTALGFYDLALQEEPNSVLSQLGRASALHKLERFSEAGAAYQSVLRNDPQNREALTNLTAIIGQSSPAEAVRRLQELEREHPNFSPIKAQIGLAQARLGNNTQAVRALNQAANMAPENVMYQYNLAVTLDRMGRGAQAMAAYERTLAALIQGVEAPPGLSRLAVERRLNFLRTR